MNVGDLVKIATEASRCSSLAADGAIGIIVNETETSWPHVDDGEPIDNAFPELFFNVYNFSEGTVLVYNSFEMKILNKAPAQTSNTKEGYR